MIEYEYQGELGEAWINAAIATWSIRNPTPAYYVMLFDEWDHYIQRNRAYRKDDCDGRYFLMEYMRALGYYEG